MGITAPTSARVLLVDENGPRGAQFTEAVSSCRREAKVTVQGDLNAAHHLLYNEYFTVVVLNPQMTEEDLEAFVESGRATRGGQNAAFVLIIDEDIPSEDNMALGMLAGVDGFLNCPFSSDGVNELFSLSGKIKTQRVERVLKDEIGVVLKEVKRHLDLLCASRDESIGTLARSSRLQTLATSIKDFASKNTELYYRMLIGSFIWETREAPQTGSISYRGRSERVRKLVATRARKALSGTQTDVLDE